MLLGRCSPQLPLHAVQLGFAVFFKRQGIREGDFVEIEANSAHCDTTHCSQPSSIARRGWLCAGAQEPACGRGGRAMAGTRSGAGKGPRTP